MSSKEIVTPDDTMALALEQCREKIIAAFRRGIEATRTMAKELLKIRDRELYRAKDYKFFKDYILEELHWDLTSVYRVIKVAEIVQRLESEGLALPENESQVIELSKLEPEYQAPVWRRIMDVCERDEEPITLQVVRDAVDMQERRLAQKEAEQKAKETVGGAKPKGVQVSLDLEEEVEKKGNGETPVPVERQRLSEKGEAALAKIRKVCGDEVADAIEGLRVQISERDLCKWAEQGDQTIYNLAYYVVNQGWSVSKALNYEARMVDGNTDITTLITMCRSRGGRLGVTFDDARVTVEIMAS